MARNKILTAKEAADQLNASRGTVTAWCRKGKFPNARKIVTPFGDHWEIPESDLSGVEIKMGRPKKNES
jgi:excisionase family DNA binding protein